MVLLRGKSKGKIDKLSFMKKRETLSMQLAIRRTINFCDFIEDFKRRGGSSKKILVMSYRRFNILRSFINGPLAQLAEQVTLNH